MEYKKSPTCLSIPLKQKSGSANQHLAQVHSETNGVIVKFVKYAPKKTYK